MPQFLAPNSNVTQTSYTGGFAEIDENPFNDGDIAYGAINSSVPILEVGLTDPAVTPGGVNGVVRWRSARRNGVGTIGSGNAITGTCGLYQGTTLITSDAYSPGSFATREFFFTLSSVSNFNDIRLRFTQTASGGNNNNNRSGLAVSWAQVELPDRRRITLIL